MIDIRIVDAYRPVAGPVCPHGKICVIESAYPERLIEISYFIYNFSFYQHAETLALVHLHVYASILLPVLRIGLDRRIEVAVTLGIYKAYIFVAFSEIEHPFKPSVC